MSTTTASTQPTLPAGADIETEYRSIESALLESALGRWFLAEHSRRARRVDSVRLDDALSKLQQSLRQPPALLGQLSAEITSLQGEIQTARARVLAKPSVITTEPAPANILQSVEALHHMAWNLQAAPVDVAACQQIARHAADIYAQSVGQAAHSQRAIDVAAALDSAIVRLNGILQTLMLEAASEAALQSST